MVSKILITGASGLLGQALVQQATAKGYDVCSVYNEHKPQGGRAVRVDLTDAKSVNELLRLERPPVVINTASITDVDLCEREPELATRVNGTAAGLLAEACDKAKVFLVQLSTDYVFNGSRGNYREDDKPAPINKYGSSKLLGERLVMEHENTCVARGSVVYGWGRPYRANFGTWLYDKLSKGEHVNVVSDQFASPTLNTNLASMTMELAEERAVGLVHAAGATKASRYEFAVRLANEFHFDPNLIAPVKSESTNWVARRPKDSSLDVTKATKLLNNKPLTLSDAMQEFARQLPTG
jgi:dTDP-4-dehydrorhamnose reductase